MGMKEAYQEKKEAYQEKIEAQLREWAVKIDALKAKADRQRADTKLAYYEQIEMLRQKQANAQLKLDSLKRTGEDARDELKQGVDRAWNELKEAIGTATKKVT
jgi:hypothetical protein